MRKGTYIKTRHNTNWPNRPAFTLIELLVVISTISLLMGILLPAFGKAKNKARRAYCQSNLRQIGVAFRSYLDDNRDIMPRACALPWDITDPKNPDYTPPITKFLGPLLREPEVFICKADTEQKYYLRTGATSYYYNGRSQRFSGWTDGLGGTAIAASRLAQSGVKEKNIDVMSDFDAVHGSFGKPNDENYKSGKNYLYADWHVGDAKKQE